MRIYLLFTFILAGLNGSGQQYQFWQGTGGYIDFRTEPPTIGLNNEGDIRFTGSICDDSSQVLFYFTHPEPTGTHHFRLKNSANDDIIPSNEGWYIGFGSYYRNVLLKANDSIYYLFYPAHGSSNSGRKPGFHYTKLNRNLRNGQGDIVHGFVDVSILSGPCIDVFATQTSSGSWWVYTNRGDSIYRVEVNQMGVSNPKVQYFPSILSKFNDPGASHGITRISHTNKKVIRKEYDYSVSNGILETQTSVFLFDYDENSGEFSNPTLLFQSDENSGDPNKKNLPSLSEMEFSPNDSFVYLLFNNWNHIDTTRSEIWLSQYETFASNPGNTETAICRTNDSYYNYVSHCLNLRMGQNQKMYLGSNSRSDDIGLIEYPNKKGQDCRLQIKRSLKNLNCSSSGGYGCALDNFPFSRFHGLRMDFKNAVQCSDSSIHLENLCDTSQFNFYQWYLYSVNESGKLLDSSTAFEPIFSHYDTGRYYVSLRARTKKGFQPWFSDTILHYPVFPKVSFSTTDSSACRYTRVFLKDQSRLILSNPQHKPSWTYHFSDGRTITLSDSGSVDYVFIDTGYYHVSLQVFNGYCTSNIVKDSFIYVWNAPRPGIVTDRTLGCQPLDIRANRKYFDPISAAYYRIDRNKDSLPADSILNNDAPFHYSYPVPGTYCLGQTLVGPSGCITHDSIYIHVQRGFYPEEHSDIQLAGVINNGSVQLIYSLHPVGVYHLLEISSEKTEWMSIDSLEQNSVIDLTVEVQKQPYYYRIKSVDSCGIEHTGQLGTSILLQGTNSNNEVILMTWTAYENWNNGVLKYDLEYQNEFNQWESLATIVDTNIQLSEFLESGVNSICYRISAWKDAGGDSISYSNTACVPILPIIWVPNAFSPNGDSINDSFYVTTYGIVDLKVEIFNRYGARVYQGNGLNQRWNGTFMQKDVPEGVYLIRIEGKNQQGTSFNQNANLTLFR